MAVPVPLTLPEQPRPVQAVARLHTADGSIPPAAVYQGPLRSAGRAALRSVAARDGPLGGASYARWVLEPSTRRLMLASVCSSPARMPGLSARSVFRVTVTWAPPSSVAVTASSPW